MGKLGIAVQNLGELSCFWYFTRILKTRITSCSGVPGTVLVFVLQVPLPGGAVIPAFIPEIFTCWEMALRPRANGAHTVV